MELKLDQKRTELKAWKENGKVYFLLPTEDPLFDTLWEVKEADQYIIEE